MSWSDERVALLRKLWNEGHSATQVAQALGGVTRNAVIGKVHRLGLSQRTAPTRVARRVRRPARPREVARIAPSTHVAPPAPREEHVKLEPMITEDGVVANIISVQESMCKFPIGDPSEENFALCGRKTNGCGPYCAEHARIAYQPRRRAS